MNNNTLTSKAIALLKGSKIMTIEGNALSLDNGIDILIDSPHFNEVKILNRTADNLPALCFNKEEATEPAPDLFPNGIDSWIETHYEVSAALNADAAKDQPSALVRQWQQAEGSRPGLYQIAKELTNEFENLNKGRQWDGEFYDEIDGFMDGKLSRNPLTT
jgi:hypothetical protein